MKHLFVVNPTAGGRNRYGEVYDAARAAFAKRREPFEVYVTRGPMDAARIVSERAASGEELRIYSCGGDGTLNECVCGAYGFSNVAVAPYSTGTGNDFTRMFGEDRQFFRDVEALINGTTHPIDLIDCNGRLCVNIASVGADARIGADVHKYSCLPIIGGSTGYVTSLVVNFVKGLTRHMEISGCGYEGGGEYTLACFCNGRFYGGGFNPVPDAAPDDGLLDILIVKGVSRFKAAGLVLTYAKGEYEKLPKYITHLRGTEISVRFEEDNVVNIDGEAIYCRELNVKLIPRGMNLIVPAGMKFFRQ